MTDGTKTLLVVGGVAGVTALVLTAVASYTRDSRRDYATGIRGLSTAWMDKPCVVKTGKRAGMVRLGWRINRFGKCYETKHLQREWPSPFYRPRRRR